MSDDFTKAAEKIWEGTASLDDITTWINSKYRASAADIFEKIIERLMVLTVSNEEYTAERKKYMDLVCEIIAATGVDVPAGGIGPVEAVKKLRDDYNQCLYALTVAREMLDELSGGE